MNHKIFNLYTNPYFSLIYIIQFRIEDLAKLYVDIF